MDQRGATGEEAELRRWECERTQRVVLGDREAGEAEWSVAAKCLKV